MDVWYEIFVSLKTLCLTESNNLSLQNSITTNGRTWPIFRLEAIPMVVLLHWMVHSKSWSTKRNGGKFEILSIQVLNEKLLFISYPKILTGKVYLLCGNISRGKRQRVKNLQIYFSHQNFSVSVYITYFFTGM